MIKYLLPMTLLSAAMAAHAAPMRIDLLQVVDVQADSGASLTGTAAKAEAALSTGTVANATAWAALSTGTAARAVADAAVPKSGGSATNLVAVDTLVVTGVVESVSGTISGTDAGAFAGEYTYAGQYEYGYESFGSYFTNLAGKVLSWDYDGYFGSNYILGDFAGSSTYWFGGGTWYNGSYESVDIVLTGSPSYGFVRGDIAVQGNVSAGGRYWGTGLHLVGASQGDGWLTNYNGRLSWFKGFGDLRYSYELGYALANPTLWGGPLEYCSFFLGPNPYDSRTNTVHLALENCYANCYIGLVPWQTGGSRDAYNLRVRAGTATIGNVPDDTGVRLKIGQKFMVDVILVGTNLTADPAAAIYPQIYSLNLGGTNRILRVMDQLGNASTLTPEGLAGRRAVVLEDNVYSGTRRYITADNFEAWFRAVSEASGIKADDYITVEAQTPRDRVADIAARAAGDIRGVELPEPASTNASPKHSPSR